jgi:hypothetical protein
MDGDVAGRARHQWLAKDDIVRLLTVTPTTKAAAARSLPPADPLPAELTRRP